MSYSAVPQEIVNVLPSEPLQQLEIAQRIINQAYSNKFSQSEQEAAHLRQTLTQRNGQLKALERRVQNLELEVKESQEKARQSLEEQTKLVGEKNQLLQTVKKLNRDVAKLENFKRSLLQQLQDDDEDFETADPLNHVRPMNGNASATPVTAAIAAMRRDTPGAQSAFSPSAFASPISNSSPATASKEGGSRSSPKIDGKEFFRQARARLSYEQFSSFLHNIKELNAHRQSREETLQKAKTIFGAENDDLYGAFEGLLSRHLPL